MSEQKDKPAERAEPKMHFLGEVHFDVSGRGSPASKDEEEAKTDV